MTIHPISYAISHKPCGSDEISRYENVHTIILPDALTASKAVANEIATLIQYKAAKGENCVLGLATGSTPIKVYSELVRMHKEEALSFKNVITFNLDEYYPMPPSAIQSYVYFMHEHLFNHVDILPENIHIPNGTLQMEDVKKFCQDYDKKIIAAGGLDIQILGIGRTGHIGFNEPGSHRNSQTRMITLDHITRRDAIRDFISEENVPRKAITMGVESIMRAQRVILMAWGEGKAKVVQKAVEGPITSNIPSSYLQEHDNATFVLDQAAGSELTRKKTPWLVESVDWDEEMTKRAVIWLCLQVNKPILKLTDRDYNDNGMSDLIAKVGSAYDLNIKIFNKLQHTITGWPGGKPNADDTYRPERAKPALKRCLIFSPHPDDDVISMGGTFSRLVEHGHEVHVAYQTSGNIAVNDDHVMRYVDFLKECVGAGLLKAKGSVDELLESVSAAIGGKKSGDMDSHEVRSIKGLIRKCEARAGCRFIGIPDENGHFLQMPFYETGKVSKNPIGEQDIQIIMDLLQQLKPHQIYAAGDLSDPHGTHRVCLDAIFEALHRLKNEAWMKDCYVWLYRGAWHEWEIENIDMSVPLSPDEVIKKRKAIFKHQSQKDGVAFPGSDEREFWERAEDRNRGTAQTYEQLGFAKYEAMEAFKRYYVV